jgi:tetratricopeptide (TPR) repeat protein
MLESLKAKEFIEKCFIRGELSLRPESEQRQASQLYRLLKERFWDNLPENDKEILAIFSVIAKVKPKLEEPLCERLFDDWPEKQRVIDNYYIDFIIRKEEVYSITSYEVLDTYRDFIINQLTDDQKTAIELRLAPFYKMYPQIGIKHFIQIADLVNIKDVYQNTLREMEKAYRYEDITEICKSIIKLIEDSQYSDFKFHYDILNALGHARYSLGYFKKAIIHYEKASEIARANKLAESEPYGWIGISYFNLGKYKEAINYLQQALNIAKIFREDRKLEGFWLGCLANSYRDSALPQGKELSISLYDEALSIAIGIEDHENESRWLANKGNTIRYMGQAIEAMEYYKQALKIAEEIGDKFLQGRWLHNIGCTYADLNQYDESTKYYKMALEISHEVGDHYNEGIALGNLANQYKKAGEFTEAINLYKRALEITVECKDIERAKGHVSGILSTYKNINKLAEIIEYLKEKLTRTEERGDREAEIFWLIYLGYVFQDSSQLKEAKETYNKALEIAKQIKNQEYENSILYLLGEVSLLEIEKFYAAGQTDMALENCNNLIVKILSKTFADTITSLHKDYRIKYPLDNLTKEIETYKNAIVKDPSNNILHMSLADCFARKGDLAEALLQYNKAIELNPSHILTVISLIEVTVWRKQYEEAISIYNRWKDRFVLDSDKVMASWIVCTASALKGISYEDFIAPLIDMEISLVNAGYGSDDILPYFAQLYNERFPIERLIRAIELYIIFKRHFIDFRIEEILQNITQDIPQDIKGILMELLKGIGPSGDSLLIKAYMKRGLIYRMLGNLNMAIKDYIIATIYHSHNDAAYMAWGACLAQKGDLEKAIPKYGMSILLNPRNNMAILGKMETEICIGKYSDAISTYEILKESEITPQEKVISTFLLCLSLALEGKPYEDYIAPLLNLEVKLSEKHDWCNVEIDRHLTELKKTVFDTNRVTKAKELQALFKNHFIIQ